jgi:prepilin-type N-terminal cleavage/methylation domain-containing protein
MYLKKFNQTGEGFTLIELLVAIVIIGLLSSIALPSYLNQAAKARASEARAALGAINRAQQAYYLEKASMAGNSSDLSVRVGGKFYTYQMNLINERSVFSTARVLPASNIKDLKQYDSAIQLNSTNDFFGQVICESLETNQDPGGATAPTAPGTKGTCNPITGKVLD